MLVLDSKQATVMKGTPMNLGIDPETGWQIDAETYVQRYGRKALGSIEDLRPFVWCETCTQNMRHVAGKTDDSWGHFSHFPNAGYCPTKASAARPYGSLRPTDPDPKRGMWMRQEVLHRWRWVFAVLGKYVPMLDAKEFVELIRVADNDGVWGYRNLELIQVPELLLMIRDFTPETSRRVLGQSRKYWFRFWFSANITRINDLWITPPGEVTLFRASFTPPTGRRKIPHPDDLVKLKKMDRIHTVPELDPDIRYDFATNFIPRSLNCR